MINVSVFPSVGRSPVSSCKIFWSRKYRGTVSPPTSSGYIVTLHSSEKQCGQKKEKVCCTNVVMQLLVNQLSLYLCLSVCISQLCADLLMLAVVEWEAVAGLVSPPPLSQEDMASQVRSSTNTTTHYSQFSSHQEDETSPLIAGAISPDPELLAVATKFVAEIIEKAKAEAAIRLKRKKLVSRNF